MGSAHRQRHRSLLAVGTYVLLLVVVLVLYALGVLRTAELGIVDEHFKIRGSKRPPGEIALVQIDAKTLQALGVQFPFPRRLHAQVIDRLRAAGARVIVYDVQFSEPTTAADDNALIDAISRAGNVVLATTETTPSGEPNVLGGGGILGHIHATAGNGNFSVDRGAVIRHVPFEVDGLQSLAVVAARRAGTRRLDPTTLSPSRTWIDFVGPPGTIPAASFSDVLRGAVPAARFRGRVVVIGASAPSLQDIHPTATGALMSGLELQGNAINTVAKGFPLHSAPGWLEILITIALGAVAPLLAARWRALTAFGGALVVAVLYAVLTQVAFERDLILPLAYPMLALGLEAVGALAVRYVTATYERERVRDLFARFVPERVVDDVLARADGLSLGGELVDGTILFSDVRGFTTYSETRPPAQVIEVLNRYLTVMSDAILDHGGTLTAYMGDGIMALFGGPLAQLDHADRALSASCAMLSRLSEFNDWVREAGLSEGFRIGIGLNTGTVLAGTVGSERRLEYTAIGDAVNTASRLEGLTKGTPHQLFVAETTRAALTRPGPELVEVGDLEVRGRMDAVKVWSLRELTPAPSAAPESGSP